MYKNNEDSINILYNDGTTKPNQSILGYTDISVLSREVTKYYFAITEPIKLVVLP